MSVYDRSEPWHICRACGKRMEGANRIAKHPECQRTRDHKKKQSYVSKAEAYEDGRYTKAVEEEKKRMKEYLKRLTFEADEVL